MISVLKADDRFHTRTDWLDSWHTFSFADHYDPDRAGYRALRGKGEHVSFEPPSGRHAWVHVARGAIELNGRKLSAGDGAAVSDERVVTLQGIEPAEVLLFDLA